MSLIKGLDNNIKELYFAGKTYPLKALYKGNCLIWEKQNPSAQGDSNITSKDDFVLISKDDLILTCKDDG